MNSTLVQQQLQEMHPHGHITQKTTKQEIENHINVMGTQQKDFN